MSAPTTTARKMTAGIPWSMRSNSLPAAGKRGKDRYALIGGDSWTSKRTSKPTMLLVGQCDLTNHCEKLNFLVLEMPVTQPQSTSYAVVEDLNSSQFFVCSEAISFQDSQDSQPPDRSEEVRGQLNSLFPEAPIPSFESLSPEMLSLAEKAVEYADRGSTLSEDEIDTWAEGIVKDLFPPDEV